MDIGNCSEAISENVHPNMENKMDIEECQQQKAKNHQCNHCRGDDKQSTYTKDDKNFIFLFDVQQNNGEECNICLGPFKVGNIVAWSNQHCGCKHTFHAQCISRWLLVRDECPICRRSFCLETEEIDDVDDVA
mmetsp:Transcript_21093/g.45144  ORF Transcript_21093/g.45144 Transcript_21093/m.45144 type:complete len:133 (+) Transcript_21093:2-400(+)